MEAESWWGDLDDALLHCIGEGAVDPAEIGRRLGISAAGVTSLLLLLAHQAKVRIRLVGGPPPNALVRSFDCPSHGKKITAEFSRDSGRRVTRVNWCSAFDPPTAITCDRRCVELDGVAAAGEADVASVDST
jgi:hypothetical protein